MIGIEFTFPTGRFHATPWGRHVNEAAQEWPPSPWRILRTFVAIWKRALDNDPACDAHAVESLLHKISPPPLFVLPAATLGHTRHFMPWFKKGPDDKALVFDAFICMDKDAPIICLWPDVVLDEKELTALHTIASNVNFFGRSESWANVRVLDRDEAVSAYGRVNCVPRSFAREKTGFDTVQVLCADPDTAFNNDLNPKHTHTKGKGKSKEVIVTPGYDPDWHLCMETIELHKKRWSSPPGAKWETYMRRKDCFAVQSRRKRPKLGGERPTMARYAFDGAVLPLVEETLRVAETARRTAMGIYRRIEERRLYQGERPSEAPLPRSEVFSGKDSEGNPLEGHRHAYYLPTDEDGDGRIDHLTIVAEMGFSLSEIKALDAIRWLPRDGGEPLNLVLLALGLSSEIRAPLLTGPSRVWISATPFIATRFPKARGKKKDPRELLGPDNQRAFARQVLLEELERLCSRCPGMKQPLEVDYLNEEHRMGAHRLRPIQFKRFRRKKSDDGGRRASGAFRIIFPEPVFGPICLGHSSHFGLGLFVPETSKPL